jgi:hypothetical protein
MTDKQMDYLCKTLVLCFLGHGFLVGSAIVMSIRALLETL